MKDMDIRGQHLIVDAYDCNADFLNNADALKNLMLETLRELQVEILLAYFHSFSPQGVTGIIAIATSHFSIHTWPEHGYAALDLYTCAPQDALPPLKKFLGKLEAKRVRLAEINRGTDGRNRPETEMDNWARRPWGNDWDMKILKEIKNGRHRILYQGQSQFHDIFLVEAKDVRLYLNEEFQFSSLDERHYHEPLVLPAMELAKSRKRVLILGGGDGLALREVIKYQEVSHVDLVDIDPKVISLAKHEPALVAVNAGSFKDKRVTVHAVDAKEYVNRSIKGYDVIIIDFPDPVDAETSQLYTKEFFGQIGKHLTSGGIIACQAISPKGTAKVFWSIAKTWKAAGFHTKPYYSVVPSFGVWGFHLASRERITKKLPVISVPHQAIESNLEAIFQFPPTIPALKTGLIINSQSNLKLHELYQEEIGGL